jgi:hypothetical protein
MKMPSMILAAIKQPSKVRAVDKTPDTAEYKEPSQHQMKVEAAHRAHREVVQDWVAGRTSDRKMSQSHTRLKKVLKGSR